MHTCKRKTTNNCFKVCILYDMLFFSRSFQMLSLNRPMSDFNWFGIRNYSECKEIKSFAFPMHDGWLDAFFKFPLFVVCIKDLMLNFCWQNGKISIAKWAALFAELISFRFVVRCLTDGMQMHIHFGVTNSPFMSATMQSDWIGHQKSKLGNTTFEELFVSKPSLLPIAF